MSRRPDTKTAVTELVRAYIIANDAVSRNRLSYSSVTRQGPEWDELAAQWKALRQAQSDLWMSTDFDCYENDAFEDAVWKWRYWKVMARRCLWYQTPEYAKQHRKSSDTRRPEDMAAITMSEMHAAEARLVEVCGLTELYRSPCSYLEEQFPNLGKCTNPPATGKIEPAVEAELGYGHPYNATAVRTKAVVATLVLLLLAMLVAVTIGYAAAEILQHFLHV